MSRLLKFAASLPTLLASFALFVLMVMTFCDVVLRSVFNAPIEVAADMTRLLMAIMVFSVLPVVSAKDGHICVDLTDGMFKRAGLTRWRNAFTDLFCGLMLVLPAMRVFDLAERSRSYGDVMEYLRLPLHYVGWFISIVTAITAAVLIVRGLGHIFAPKLMSPRHA
ncbi:TRAP transporter small permease [Roseibium aggregatum]|uniref:TRAP transporter small permease n=1 Tax=Roseibium aggregatum TaxID=187304 RepID=UPI0025ABE19E|nr:TRAP transporter small permease subunit [Roseibium aggregatum]WJS05955.1 TRAP transporter small permease subunit [Roseibium aggregatum]